MKQLAFSVGIFPTGYVRDVLGLAELVEDLGYDGVWVGDSHMIWRELYVVLGAMATRTSKITIAPGVTNTLTRHPSLTASARATLAEMTEGRVRLGIGVGDSALRNIGQKPVAAYAFEESLLLIKKLLGGGSMAVGSQTGRLSFAPGTHVPVYVATGSKGVLGLAGRIADGAILGNAKLEDQPEVFRRNAVQAGRRADEVKVVRWISCSISADARQARQAVKPMVARVAMSVLAKAVKRGDILPSDDLGALKRLQDHYDFSQHMGPEHSHLVPDRWVPDFALAGTPQEVLAQVREMAGRGIDELAIVPFGEDQETIVRTFAEQVMSAVR